MTDITRFSCSPLLHGTHLDASTAGPYEFNQSSSLPRVWYPSRKLGCCWLCFAVLALEFGQSPTSHARREGLTTGEPTRSNATIVYILLCSQVHSADDNSALTPFLYKYLQFLTSPPCQLLLSIYKFCRQSSNRLATKISSQVLDQIVAMALMADLMNLLWHQSKPALATEALLLTLLVWRAFTQWRFQIIPNAPGLFKDQNLFGSLRFTTSRAEYLEEGIKQSSDGQFSFWHGGNHIVVVSGEAARTSFQTSRGLDPTAG